MTLPRVYHNAVLFLLFGYFAGEYVDSKLGNHLGAFTVNDKGMVNLAKTETHVYAGTSTSAKSLKEGHRCPVILLTVENGQLLGIRLDGFQVWVLHLGELTLGHVDEGTKAVGTEEIGRRMNDTAGDSAG